ncbi:DnaB-like helicase N-terminal domain-containing protein [Azospirillum rugosum]
MLNRHANPEVEQALLGALLTQPAAFGRTVGRITAEDFADPVHAAIYDAIAERVSQGRTVDHRLLGDVADSCNDVLQEFGGGRTYLAGLAGGAGLPSSVIDYADTIRQLAVRRRLIDAGLRAIVLADETQRIEDAVSVVIGDAEALVDGGGAKTRSEVLAAMVAGMEKPGKVYPTGYPSIDKAWGGGMYAGRMYCIAGKGKAGKSALAGGISYALNRAGVRHAYLALEMGAQEIEQRQVARELGTHSMALIGHVHATILARAGQYAATAEQQRLNNVVYVDMPGGTMDRLRTEILAAKHRHRCAGVIVDYWQLVTGRPPGTSEEEHLRRVAEWLAATVKRLGIWVLILAQLTDDGEATAVSRTGMNRNADQLYFLRDCNIDACRWLEGKASRYTPTTDIGSASEPALKLVYPGPHFEDWGARGNDDTRQAQMDMAEG